MMHGPRLNRTAISAALASASVVCATQMLAMPAHAMQPPATTPALAPAPTLAPMPAMAARLYATARVWGNKHRDDLALQAIDKALLIAPDDPRLLAERVRAQLRLGKTQAAQTALARMQAIAPDAAITHQAADEYRVAVNGRQEMATIRLLSRSGQTEEAARRLGVLFPHGAPSSALGTEY